MSESRGIDYKHRIRRKNRPFCQYCWGCALRPTIATAEAEGRAQGRIGSRSSPISPLFFNTFILWNNSVVTNLRRLFYVVFHVLRGLRPQDAGTPSFWSVLTSESDSGPAPTVQPPPKSLQTTRYCNFFNPFYNLNCTAWERAPWRRVTEKSHLIHSKRRSGRDRESNPVHLRGK
jgi:hypothetical protein